MVTELNSKVIEENILNDDIGLVLKDIVNSKKFKFSHSLALHKAYKSSDSKFTQKEIEWLIENHDLWLGLIHNKHWAPAFKEMVFLGSWTISQVSRKSGISRPTIYELLDKLNEAGLIAESRETLGNVNLISLDVDKYNYLFLTTATFIKK